MRSNDEIVTYIDELRKKQNLSITELAKETEIAKSSLSRYLNKTRTFPLDKIEKFSKALHVKSEDILGITDEKVPKKVDLKEDPVILSYGGKPISDKQMDLIKGILDLKTQD